MALSPKPIGSYQSCESVKRLGHFLKQLISVVLNKLFSNRWSAYVGADFQLWINTLLAGS